MSSIKIKESDIREAVDVNFTIPEFEGTQDTDFFERRYKDKEKLIIVAYYNESPAGYIVGYNKYGDSSFYCWMAGVNPEFRRRGILRAMVEYMEEWARKKGYNKIKIKTRNNRREMLAFLVKEGYNFIEIVNKDKVEDNRMLLEKNL